MDCSPIAVTIFAHLFLCREQSVQCGLWQLPLVLLGPVAGGAGCSAFAAHYRPTSSSIGG